MSTRAERLSRAEKRVHSGIRSERPRWDFRRNIQLHLMILPALILILVFAYLPMAGLVMAFQDFKPWLGFANSPWIGLDNFETIFALQTSRQAIINTLVIASLKIVFNIAIPLVFALLLNEIRFMIFKRAVQTFVYLPFFISWVILGVILTDMLSVDGGLINQFLGLFGVGPIFFLGNSTWFLGTVIASDVWKNYGFSTIIYLAALTAVDPTYYEAAAIDGANRFQAVRAVTLPAILPIVLVVGTLSLGSILDGGFDQIFNLYNPLVYNVGDIIDTYVYRNGILGGRFSLATAVGLFKSVVSFILIVISFRLAYKYADYRIF